jgi:hypothetical protein
MFVVCCPLCYPLPPYRDGGAICELQSEVVGERRVALVEHQDGRYAVTITVWGPLHNWEDLLLLLTRRGQGKVRAAKGGRS